MNPRERAIIRSDYRKFVKEMILLVKQINVLEKEKRKEERRRIFSEEYPWLADPNLHDKMVRDFYSK